MNIFIMDTRIVNIKEYESLKELNNFFFDKDKKIFIGSKIIKSKLLKFLNISEKDVKLKKNKFGKPYYLKNNSEIINFNISHDGNIVVLFYNNNLPVGIDIIYNKRKQVKDFLNSTNVFSYNEINLIRNNNSLFYNIWAFKESYLKYIGCGLNNKLPEICYSKIIKNNNNYIITDCNITIINKFNFSNKNFLEVIYKKDYIISICFDKQKINEIIFKVI